MINTNSYKSVMNYDDREAFFLDSYIEGRGESPVMSRIDFGKNVEIQANAYEVLELLQIGFALPIKVRVESSYRINFIHESHDSFFVFAISVTPHEMAGTVLTMDKLGDSSFFLASEFHSFQFYKDKIFKLLHGVLKITDDKPETNWALLNPNGNISYRSMPIKETPMEILPEAYPWISNPKEYIEEYLESKSPILIMTGPPGTGKSTFIRHIINQAKEFEVTSVYDEDVMRLDNLYINFISVPSKSILVVEDADRLLERRIEDQNTTMSKILNVSDGIIDLSMKKIIFTSNIENIKDVDQALIRPGRCHDILEFRDLNSEEARVLAGKIGMEPPSGAQTYPLSEVFNGKITPKAQKFGF